MPLGLKSVGAVVEKNRLLFGSTASGLSEVRAPLSVEAICLAI